MILKDKKPRLSKQQIS